MKSIVEKINESLYTPGTGFDACDGLTREYNNLFANISGTLLRKVDACPWDYSNTPFNIKGLIRLDYAPLWFCAGLLFEKILNSH